MAYYFVGTQHNSFSEKYVKVNKYSTKLVYLDPHFVRNKVCCLKQEYATNPDMFHCD